MPTHVLVAVDGSPRSQHALEFVAAEWADARLTLLHVIDPVQAGYSAGVLPSGSETWYKEAKSEADTILTAAVEHLEAELGEDRAGKVAADVDTMTEVGRPAATIVEVAEDREVDHVVVGSHGRSGVSRLILGSVAEDVVRNSPVPVTVVR